MQFEEISATINKCGERGPQGPAGPQGPEGPQGETGATGNGIESITKTSSSGLVDTYTILFTNGNTTTFEVTNGEDGTVTPEQMEEAIAAALEDYAQQDGNYPDMAVGDAEQLTSTVFKNDKVPFTIKSTAAGCGDFKYIRELVGGTIAWNQLVNGNTVTMKSGHKYVSYISDQWAVGQSDGSAISVDYGDMIFDLTQMFGTSIANYVYGLGSDGVTWFRNFFGEDSYNFNAGELMSFAPERAVNGKSGATSSYNLANVQLRGLFKLDSANKLYADGDTYAPDGTVTRKYGIVNLGDLTWYYQSTRGIFYSSASLPNCPTVSGASRFNGLCAIYDIATANSQFDNRQNMTISIGSSIQSQRVNITNDDYSDVDQFKAAMNGVYLIYVLADETTESVEPYAAQMRIYPYPNGYELITDYFYERDLREVHVPAGHNTDYTIDLRGKLQSLPALPAAPTTAGTYTLKATVDAQGNPTYSWA